MPSWPGRPVRAFRRLPHSIGPCSPTPSGTPSVPGALPLKGTFPMRRRVPHLAFTALFAAACVAPGFASSLPETGSERAAAATLAGNDAGRVLATVIGHDDVQSAL